MLQDLDREKVDRAMQAVLRKGELKDYDTSGRGTLRFKADDPLPDDLMRRLVKARIAKISGE